MPTHTTLRGFSNIADPSISEILRTNLLVLFDWGFIDKGGFFNVTIPSSGAYGGNWHILEPVQDPYYTDGQVWQSRRQNWVWETGTSQGTPIPISGIFLDGSYIANTGSYTVDYPNGRIIFDQAQSLESEIKVAHSYKYIKITDARNIPFFRKLELNSFRPDDQFFPVSSGDLIEIGQTRLQLPLVAIEVLSNRNYEGYELGNTTRYVRTEVVFHVIAENDAIAGRITDAIAGQDEKRFFLFSPKLMAQNNAFPLGFDGDITSGNLTYPNLVAPTGDGGFRYSGALGGTVRFADTSAANGGWISPELFNNSVIMTTEVILL